MKKIGVLISGGGTNLQAIIDAIDNGIIDGKIELIISSKKDAYGLERGKNAGIESLFIDPSVLIMWNIAKDLKKNFAEKI